MSASNDDLVSVTARCLCKTHVFTSSVPKSSLPLIASLCHCYSCRHQTGALYFGCTTWPNKHEDLSPLKRYEFSSNIDLYACQTCSSQLFCKASRLGEAPEVVTSALVNEPGLVEYGSHIFVGDTIDGGASMWFRHDREGRPLKRWAGHRDQSEELEATWPSQGQKADTDDAPARPEFTPLRCHCQGVSLYFRSGVHLTEASSGSNDAELADKLKKSGLEMKSGRFPAWMDSCDSCRMDISSDITFWTTVPIICVYVEARRDVDAPFRSLKEFQNAVEMKDPRLGTLRKYESSPGMSRYSCSVCSASFFAVSTQGAADGVLDVTLGVMEHEDGARAEELLAWDYCRMDFASDAKGGWREQLNEKAIEEAKRWRGE